jgi:hypothetical protein
MRPPDVMSCRSPVDYTDEEWFEETGNCGRCGRQVRPAGDRRVCECTDCGCIALHGKPS